MKRIAPAPGLENLDEFYSAAWKKANLSSMPKIGSFDYFYQGNWWYHKKTPESEPLALAGSEVNLAIDITTAA